MACGCPVVVSKTSSLPEICGEAAIYIDPNNTIEIATALEKVLSDKILLNEMICRSVDRAKMFKWEFSAIEHLNVLSNVINHQRLGFAKNESDLEKVFNRRRNKIVSSPI